MLQEQTATAKKINALETEVKNMKLEVRNISINVKENNNNQYILSLQGPFVINTNIKFQCEIRETQEHEAYENSYSSDKKIGEHKFGFAFDVQPGKELR